MAKQKSKSDDALLELFKRADKDKSGGLTKEELRGLFKEAGRNITDSQLNDVFAFFDSKDGDKVISYEEFKKGLLEIQAFVRAIDTLFDTYDVDKSGFLERNEMKKVMADSGQKFTDAEIDEIWKRADVSGDNKISKEEFIHACT